jgi:ribosomal protein L32E
VLDRVKPKSLQELFEVMQEYCKSDKGRRRRLDRANAAKKQKQQGQWDQPKGWHSQPPKQANRQINNVSAPPDQSQNKGGGHKGGYKHNRGPKPQQHSQPQRAGGERFFYWLHGIDAQHHTHQCPSAVKMKLEWEAEEKAKAAGMAVNHVMKYQNAGPFRALPPPYHHQPYQPSAPAHVLHPP